MHKAIKYALETITGLALVWSILAYDPHNLTTIDDYVTLRKFRKQNTLIQKPQFRPQRRETSDAREENKIPQIHMIGFGESLYSMVKKYWGLEEDYEIKDKISEIQNLNWSEEEIKRRDRDGDGLVDLVFFNERIQLR